MLLTLKVLRRFGKGLGRLQTSWVVPSPEVRTKFGEQWYDYPRAHVTSGERKNISEAGFVVVMAMVVVRWCVVSANLDTSNHERSCFERLFVAICLIGDTRFSVLMVGAKISRENVDQFQTRYKAALKEYWSVSHLVSRATTTSRHANRITSSFASSSGALSVTRMLWCSFMPRLSLFRMLWLSAVRDRFVEFGGHQSPNSINCLCKCVLFALAGGQSWLRTCICLCLLWKDDRCRMSSSNASLCFCKWLPDVDVASESPSGHTHSRSCLEHVVCGCLSVHEWTRQGVVAGRCKRARDLLLSLLRRHLMCNAHPLSADLI